MCVCVCVCVCDNFMHNYNTRDVSNINLQMLNSIQVSLMWRIHFLSRLG